MYKNPTFHQADECHLFNLIEEFPLGTLILSGASRLDIAHVPFLLDKEQRSLFAHLPKADSCAPRIDKLGSQPVVCVFHGPECYVSPRWYLNAGNVPTWNYVVAHVRGTVRRLEDDAVVSHLDQLSTWFESKSIEGGEEIWRLDQEDEQLIKQLVHQIIAIEVRIDAIEGKFKLNQNKTQTQIHSVIENLKELDQRAEVNHAPCKRDIIRYMIRHSVESAPGGVPSG